MKDYRDFLKKYLSTMCNDNQWHSIERMEDGSGYRVLYEDHAVRFSNEDIVEMENDFYIISLGISAPCGSADPDSDISDALKRTRKVMLRCSKTKK